MRARTVRVRASVVAQQHSRLDWTQLPQAHALHTTPSYVVSDSPWHAQIGLHVVLAVDSAHCRGGARAQQALALQACNERLLAWLLLHLLLLMR